MDYLLLLATLHICCQSSSRGKLAEESSLSRGEVGELKEVGPW